MLLASHLRNSGPSLRSTCHLLYLPLYLLVSAHSLRGTSKEFRSKRVCCITFDGMQHKSVIKRLDLAVSGCCTLRGKQNKYLILPLFPDAAIFSRVAWVRQSDPFSTFGKAVPDALASGGSADRVCLR